MKNQVHAVNGQEYEIRFRTTPEEIIAEAFRDGYLVTSGYTTKEVASDFVHCTGESVHELLACALKEGLDRM